VHLREAKTEKGLAQKSHSPDLWGFTAEDSLNHEIKASVEDPSPRSSKKRQDKKNVERKTLSRQRGRAVGRANLHSMFDQSRGSRHSKKEIFHDRGTQREGLRQLKKREKSRGTRERDAEHKNLLKPLRRGNQARIGAPRLVGRISPPSDANRERLSSCSKIVENRGEDLGGDYCADSPLPALRSERQRPDALTTGSSCAEKDFRRDFEGTTHPNFSLKPALNGNSATPSY